MSEPFHSLDDIARQHSLLATKLRPPHLRARLVRRPRLTAHLDDALQHKLTLVSAAAGSGKTTLLSEWRDTAGQQRWPIAWVSLDKGDNDPVRFWSYVAAALDAFQPGISRTTLMSLHATPLPDLSVMQDGRARLESILAALVNEVATLPRDVVAVLDDYHAIESSAVHDSLAYWLEHVPDCVHLVIASREDPPLPLARLRVRGELAEIRGTDLRFTQDEVATYFNEVMGLRLPDEDIATIEARTEGWIAGLQMAALSMQGRQDTVGFVAAFAGSHRFVADYLITEVLQRQPENVQSFLLQTSVLDRLNGPLCDAVTGRQDSQRMLERLDAANLFVIPLDDERRWYRYHHLFGEWLRTQLNRTHPDLAPDLHRRACDWHERNGLVADAIYHACAMRDFELAARLVERAARPTWMRGEVGILLDWLKALPEAIIRSRPRLGLAYAWALVITNHLDRAEEYLRGAEAVAGSAAGEREVQEVMGEAASLRTLIAAFRDDLSQVVEHARQARMLLPPGDSFLRGAVAVSLGYIYDDVSGDMAAATQAFDEALTLGHASGNHALTLMAMCQLGEIHTQRGRLHDALLTYQQTLRLAEERGARQFFAVSRVRWGMALLYYEWNDLETATAHLNESIRIGRQWRQPRLLVHAYGLLALVKQAKGDPDGAVDMIRQAEQATREFYTPVLIIGSLALYQLTLWKAQGDIQAALRWMREHGEDWREQIGRVRDILAIVLARVLIDQSRKAPGDMSLREATLLLEQALRRSEAAGFQNNALCLLALQALVLHEQGQMRHALELLRRAVSLAEPEGYVRSFLNCGEPMAELLLWSVESNAWPEPRLAAYVDGLLSHFGLSTSKESAANTATRHPESGEMGWVEPLTARELQVLQLVAIGASDQEIAEELGLARATVKTHLRHIYRKLQVGRRTQAIVRARLLRLLP